MEACHLTVMSLVLVSIVMLLFGHCHADTNMSAGTECSEADNSTLENSFQTNLNNLLDSLSSNVPLNNGFYRATMGKSSHKIYGLVQCRGDVSARDCANCTKESVAVALHQCSKSKQVGVWFTWCFLRYSDENFFGVVEPSFAAIDYGADFDDPVVVSKGLAFMGGLISGAPKQRLMFQMAVLDVGESGNRYGMAQCTRDISRTDCSKCLDAQLGGLGSTLSNKRGWEIYGKSCSMWYHDYQFYTNISTTTASEGNRRSLHGGVMTGILTFTILAFLMIL
ncbi:cysteine-rich repeat secretory protein 38-like [Vitis riparia]|uniref:cysteine-rich repeat secretory protein 38-like n=1 Tax=Vitis riparia TaxID=96939 RepID=UPI00155AA2BB|nr:cysteine-rich repeat secretory protein 38-like [Vitis riparia]